VLDGQGVAFVSAPVSTTGTAADSVRTALANP